MVGVLGALELPTISDPVEAALRLYRGLRSLWDFLNEGQRELERFNGRPICVEKCGQCCQKATPLVSMLEVAYLAGRLHPLEAVRETALSWARTPNVKLRAQDIPYGQVLRGQPLAALQADNSVLQDEPCPFLTPEMGCQIHPVRPLICRSYGVTLTPDEWCPRPLGARETRNSRNLVGRLTPLGLKIAGSTIGLWKAMRHMERSDLAVMGFLPMLVAETLAKPDVKRLQEQGLIQPAKMGKGRWVLPNLFGGQL